MLRADNSTRFDRLPESSFLTPTRNATQPPVERKMFEDGSKNTVRFLTIDSSGHDRFSVNSVSCCSLQETVRGDASLTLQETVSFSLQKTVSF
jgi:hypothetical protein